MRRAAGVLAAVSLLLIVLWWLWPAAPPVPSAPVEVDEQHRTRRVLEAITAEDGPDGDDPVLREAASGDFGLEMANRVCALCTAGVLAGSACEVCPKDGLRLGRVFVDVVDDEGRPWKEHETMVQSTCGRRGGLNGGSIDLPEGHCTLTPMRVDGVLDVHGPPVDVEIVAGEEQQVVLTLPSTPWGGVGVDLVETDGVVTVRGLLVDTAASAHDLAGAVLLSIDGEPVSGTAKEAAALLQGEVGTPVLLELEDPDTGETREVELERGQLRGHQVFPGMTPG